MADHPQNGAAPDKDRGAAFWDAKFAASDYVYGTRPNAFVADQSYLLNPGSRVLAVADGEGRNGVWLAAQGHKVTSIDFSPRALQKAAALALGRSVALRTVCADLLDWDRPADTYDAAAMTFLHLPPDHRRPVLAGIARTLKPGGLLLAEGFAPAQVGMPSGGPRDPALLYDPEVLSDELAAVGLAVVQCAVAEVTLSEGRGHNGPAMVTRLVARKPEEKA
ncbi:MAG: methyltransferase domain-containing protein [Rhodospirillaceae bacterium]|nr:methyltransferase domain-containing protein [Rhodospirillaceae bacterium]